MRSDLDGLERYYDAVPRDSARTEQIGALTLFVADHSAHDYYGRPSIGATDITADDVRTLLDRQRALGIARTMEWVGEVTPSLASAARAAGMQVNEHPLMMLVRALEVPSHEVSARVLGADDADVPVAIAVAHLAFGEPGTQVGQAAAEQLRAKTAEVTGGEWEKRTRRRIATRATVAAAAYRNGELIASGQHNPVGAVTEIVGVGTLPSARRLGAGLAVTACLIAEARAHGAETVFLSASDDAVARIYARAGFDRVGTAFIAEASD
jgi:ribosomal protein S18 acetylase RimI-like enzyme